MEDKKIKAGSVAIGICLVIIAVLLFGIVLLFHKWNNEKIILQSKIISLENELKEKDVKEVVKDEDNLSNENLEKMAKEVLDKYMDLQHFENGGIGPAPQIFAELGLMSEKEILTLEQNLLGTDPSIYIKSNVEYKKFKDSLLNYVTENYFEKNFSHYTNMDGCVEYCSTAGGIVVTEVEKVTLNKIEENKYIFDVTLKDVEVYEHYLNPEEGENITEEECFFDLKITFELINDKLFIDKWE